MSDIRLALSHWMPLRVDGSDLLETMKGGDSGKKETGREKGKGPVEF